MDLTKYTHDAAASLERAKSAIIQCSHVGMPSYIQEVSQRQMQLGCISNS